MKKSLKKLLGQGRRDEVLQQLMSKLDKHGFEKILNEVLLQSARLEEYEEGKRNGTTSHVHQQIQLARINQSILQILDQLSEDLSTIINKPTSPSLSRTSKRPIWQWIVMAGGLIIILAGIAGVPGINPFTLFKKKIAQGPLQLTVYVHGPEGKQDVVLDPKGSLIVDFGNRRDKRLIGEDGRTNFGEIEPRFLNKEIGISIQSGDFIPSKPAQTFIYDGEPIYYEVKPSCRFCTLAGTVQDENNQLMAGIIISIKGTQLMDTTDMNGNFRITLSPEQEKKEYVLVAIQDGKIIWDNFVTPNEDTPIEILITK